MLDILHLNIRVKNIEPFFYPAFPHLALDDIRYDIRRKFKKNTATGLDGWRPHELKALPDCFFEVLLDMFHLCEHVGRFPKSF